MSIFKEDSPIFLLLTVIHIPIIAVVYKFSISFLKNKKQSARRNEIVSSILLLFLSFSYTTFIASLAMNFDFSESDNRPYDTIIWELTPTETTEYKIYTDIIPLTCEDLYGKMEYPYYSYEEEIKNSIFLKSSTYGQYAPPQKNAPPEIEYTIYEPKFNFVYDCILKDLKTLPKWTSQSIEKIDPFIFNAEDAYILDYNYDMDAYNNRKYLLTYKDKMIHIILEKHLTLEQIVILCEKLNL